MSSKPVSIRLPYTSPRLTVFGDVATLTLDDVDDDMDQDSSYSTASGGSGMSWSRGNSSGS